MFLFSTMQRVLLISFFHILDPPWEIAADLNDIKHLAGELQIRFFFVDRFVNLAAHWVAKELLKS